MQARRFFSSAALAASLVAGAAAAQVAGELTLPGPNDNTWSATSGRTVGAGNGLVLGEVGWPGLSIQYSRGLDDKTDLGFKASFLYGFENTTNSLVGLNLAVVYKRQLYENGRLAIAGHIDPGLTFYGNRGPDTGNLYGVGAPLGAVVGFRLDDRLTITAGADIANLISFSNPAGILFGPMVGAGAEFKLDKDLAVTLRTRFGPEFSIVNGGSNGEFALQTLVGLAYNTR